jgi:peptide/nickel transport system permease protein
MELVQTTYVEKGIAGGGNTNFSFRAYAWKQLKKNTLAYYSFKILVALLIIALLAPILANDQPLYMKYKGQSFFPAFAIGNKISVKDPKTKVTEQLQLDITDWKQLDADFVVWAPVAYAPNKTDLLNFDYVAPSGEQLIFDKKGAIVPMPFKFRHWLGTNKRGEDVLSGLIHGTSISLMIGILSMSIASVLGLILGAMAGYFGDTRLTTSRGVFWMLVIGLVFAWYYAFSMRSYALADALGKSGLAISWALAISFLIFASVLFCFYILGKIIALLPWFNKVVFIPVDSIVSRIIEVLISLPRLILIISIAAIAKPSIINLMIIIGLTTWTEIARFTRAEFLRIRQLEYIQAAESLGFSNIRIMFKHALPNGMAPALITIAFGIASAILIESGLSFLGIGVPADTVTWGSLLSAGKENYNAWWLVVFPGLAIFVTVTVYNLLGEGLRDALDPRLKK